MRFWRVAPFVLCVALYWPVLGQHLLSDDMSVAYALHQWNAEGEMWTKLLGKFVSGLDSPSFYYRPLTFLSFGLNYASVGVAPFTWHVVNLAGHLLAGAAVFRIVEWLQQLRGIGTRDSIAGPVAATSLFLLWGTNAEAVAWVSGRYDVFATMLVLWACAHYLQSASAFGGRAMTALAFGALALCSKESAAVVPGLIGCLAWIRHGSKPFGDRWRAIIVDMLPWLALIGGYFALRHAIFGNAFQVYPEAKPLERISGGEWLKTLDAARPWLEGALPSPIGLKATAALIIVTLLASLAWALRERAAARAFVGIAGAMVVTLALLLPHLSGLSPNGEGGRLFYSTGAMTAILLALPLTGRELNGRHVRSTRLLSLAMMVLIGVQAFLLWSSLHDWRRAGGQMGRLVHALPDLAKRLGSERYALLFAPDAIGAAPFIRNANGGMVLPPVQQQPLLNRILIFSPSAAGGIPVLINKRMIPVLKSHSLEDATAQLRQADPSEDPVTLWPTDLFCWDVEKGELKTVILVEGWRDAARWIPALHEGLHRAGCE